MPSRRSSRFARLSSSTRQQKGVRMPFVEEKQFKYPAEDECLVRRLGAGVIAAWPHLPEEARAHILNEAKSAWDREHSVSKLPQKLEAIIRRAS
jgi:hypothetical protein